MFKIPAKDLVWAIHSPQIMGIINCTSDSFYAGSRQQNLEAVLSKVAQFIKEGVSIVDIGAQSTRPNATLLSAELEIEQLVPIVYGIRKAEKSSDGNAKTALSLVRQAAEQLPLKQGVAGNLKGLADNARSLAKERFEMLKKDPAYNAAVNDIVPADSFIQKFVINGVNKNVQTMVNHLGKDSPARQHMAAGTINWLADKAGIYGEQANFSQAGFNKGLKQLDAVKNTQEIFDPATATHLRTLGNVAGYTQFQPRGSFVNNSNTLVGSLAEKGKQAIAVGVEKGGNLLVPGLQLGTTVMEMRARRAAEAETRKALELGAGTKQTGKNQVNNLNNP